MKKKLIWMIEFEPGSDYQAEAKVSIDTILNVFVMQLESRHKDNKITIKYMEKDLAHKTNN